MRKNNKKNKKKQDKLCNLFRKTTKFVIFLEIVFSVYSKRLFPGEILNNTSDKKLMKDAFGKRVGQFFYPGIFSIQFYQFIYIYLFESVGKCF